MFEKLTTEDERGQVGIGTLIVFIAMVLVAAIAAGVLINTAGVLQTQASDTGSETQEQVANQIEVLHASGDVDRTSGGTGTVDSIDMTLMKSAGSNEIDLTSMTVQYTSGQTDKTLTHGDSATSAHFATSNLHGQTDGTSLTTKEDRVELTLDTKLIESSNAEGTITISGSPAIENGDAEIGNQPVDEDDDMTFTIDDSHGNLAGEEVQILVGGADGENVASVSGASHGDELVVDSEDFSEGDSLHVALTDGTDDDAQITDSISYVDQDTITGLQPGSSATVELVDQSGAQFTYGISVPSTFGTASVVEV